MSAPFMTVRDRLLSWASRGQAPLRAGAASRDPDRTAPSAGEILTPAAIVREGDPLPPARRLIVLILGGEIDEMELARKVWALASPAWLGVLYLWLRCWPDEEARARVSLANLAALTRDDFTHVLTALSFDPDWVQAIRSHWQPGDLLVCHAGQPAPGRRVVPQSLPEFIVRKLGLPVVALFGSPPRNTRRAPALRFIWELLPFVIVGGMFVIQTRIVRFTQDITQTGLLILSIAGEFGLIWAWNRLFNLGDS